MTKLKYITIPCLLLCALIMSSCSILRHSITDSSSISTDDSIDYKTYTIGDMSFDTPASWSAESDYSNYYIYDKHGDLLLIHLDDFEEDSLDYSYFRSFKEGVKSKVEDYKEYTEGSTLISNEIAYNYKYTGIIKNTNYFFNSYIVAYNSHLYSITFSTKGDTQCDDFRSEEKIVITSVVFDSQKSEETNAYEDPTKKNIEQEPTTEEETEEPTTEKLETYYKLYEDDNIVLSYYQMYDYKYDSDEKIIEFLAENKTDKQLTIQSEIVSVDGMSYKGIMSDPVSPNSKGIIDMHTSQKIPTDNPSSIGITINYFDGTLGDTINEHGIVIPEVEIK